MPNMKIHKTIVDRFKVTGRGKILRRKIGQRHLKIHKSKTNIRRGNRDIQVTGLLEKKLKKLLGI